MRLYTFEGNGTERIGVEHDGRLVEIGGHRNGMRSFVGSGRRAIDAAVDAAVRSPAASRYSLDEVKILPPIRPGKILCSGINYRSHLEENPNGILPARPFFFSKLPTAVIGPNESIVHPRLTQQLDYEVELAVIIGSRMKGTPESEVMGSVAGYTILHDVSARDVQFTDNQLTLGKNFDTFAPIGPCVVTADEITDPGKLALRTYLNGRLMQDGSTIDWVFPLPFLLSFLSQVMTLEPGDVVSTGTPAGVGLFRNPQVFMRPGDRVRLEIEGIGSLENSVISEE